MSSEVARTCTVADSADGDRQLAKVVLDVGADLPHALPDRRVLLFGAGVGFRSRSLDAPAFFLRDARDGDGGEHDDEADHGQLAKLRAFLFALLVGGVQPREEGRVREVEVAKEVADDVAEVGVAAEPGVRDGLEVPGRHVEHQGLPLNVVSGGCQTVQKKRERGRTRRLAWSPLRLKSRT